MQHSTQQLVQYTSTLKDTVGASYAYTSVMITWYVSLKAGVVHVDPPITGTSGSWLQEKSIVALYKCKKYTALKCK